MADWPAGVPFFKAHGSLSRSGPVDASIRTAMAHGPAKVRRRFTAAVRNFTGATPFLTKAQLATFETFFADTLKMGSLSFTATDPLDCTEKTFRFVGSYSITPSGRAFRVSAQLEIMP
jgi:hypothetical protein